MIDIHVIRIHISTFKVTGTTVFAQEALAGLAAKVSFDKVTLKKTDSFKAATPGGEKLLPYRDLMLIHVKGEYSS